MVSYIFFLSIAKYSPPRAAGCGLIKVLFLDVLPSRVWCSLLAAVSVKAKTQPSASFRHSTVQTR